MKLSTKKGFTLIELLVVIAIIGILASVVLASLNSARSGGADAAIKSELNQIRTASEIYYADNGDYGAATTACANMFAGTQLTGIISSLQDRTSNVACVSNGDNWTVYGDLDVPAEFNDGYCVDSTGASRDTATVTAAATVTGCPATATS